MRPVVCSFHCDDPTNTTSHRYLIKRDFSRKTTMEDGRRRQLLVLFCVVFFTEKQTRRKGIGVKSRLRRCYVVLLTAKVGSDNWCGRLFFTEYIGLSSKAAPHKVGNYQICFIFTTGDDRVISLTLHTWGGFGQIIICDQAADQNVPPPIAERGLKLFHCVVGITQTQIIISAQPWSCSSRV